MRFSSSDLMFDANDSFNSSNEYASSVKSIKIVKRNNFFELPQYDVPSQDDYFNCIVTMASNPSNFTVRMHSLNGQYIGPTIHSLTHNFIFRFGNQVQPYKPELEFKNMMELLQKYCSTNKETVSEGEIREGECFAGQNKDSIWYR